MTDRMRGWALAVCGIPLVAGVALAAAVAAGGANGVVTVAAPAAAVLVVSGVIASALLVVIEFVRARQAGASARMRDAAARAERDAHRRFLARLDHELKNPLTAIRSALAAETASEPSPHLVVAASQADRLASLVSGLRGLASLETRAIERRPVDMAALAAEEADAVSTELVARGGARRITLTFPNAPWPLPPVAGDADLLAVAIRNLILNAAKYSTENALIDVRGSEDAGMVVIEVADTGVGIGPQDLPFVWDELWRAADARTVEGTGLGLSLVRVVAERHGGDVAIRSQPGRGTSVRVRLPAATV